MNVWRYYNETFHFHNGRLLLRGPNGTGKSKALELLLPYLFDANLRPTRLSTFGGSERTMFWNLMGDGYPGTTRVGYVWLECGRTGDDGWFTCGARLQASKHSRNVTATYFVTHRRIDTPGGLSLLTADGRPLTRGDLAAAIGDSGGVFDSAADYRRMVRHTLFPEFTEEQYEALISALLKLRTPKPSEHLDPKELSKLLSEALPVIDQQDVAEIAEGFEKLDRRREELARLAQEVEAARGLAERNRTYARRVLRAAAASLISATSTMDGITRKARESREAYEKAKQRLAELTTEQERLAAEDDELAHRIDGLQESDLFREGQQLDRLRRDADTAAQAAAAAERKAAERAREADDDAAKASAVQAAYEQAEQAADRARGEAGQAAERVGFAASFEEVAAARDVPTARKLLQAAVDSRTRQVDQGRKALYEHVGAVAERRKAETRLEDCREQEARAEARLVEAQTRREEALARLREAIERWCSECRELPLAARLDELVDAAEDENAVMRVVNDAAAAVADELTRAETTLDARRQALAEERARLDAERAELARRTVLAPEPPRTRTADRSRLPGGPLWRLVDWRPGVDESTQAGVEAALEASGLLDAWVLPSGELAVDGHDTFADGALTTPAPGSSLADVLTVDPDAPVPRGAALLRGIAFGVTAPDHPAAIGADGTWRLGAARGSWAKPAAGFIGAAAQERARARRIAELTARIEDLDERIAGVRAELDALAGRREALNAEQRRRPGHDELRAATGQVARAEAEVAARADAVSRAQQEHAAVERRVATALRQLSLVAGEHGLPTEEAALDAVDAALGAYRNKCHAWLDLRQQAATLAGQAQAAAERAARSRRDADAAAQEAADLRRLPRP
ncbi:TIGR02680 family protein [Carbonactinospora thermoautotrophica]|uniref:TIGR02680 family protein n=2 Tax=Carbonactinospora thermoautotrophica TaxID=1469144 RepID=UPI0013013875|nr:TIGR02680 family protein [Carbonactinospora thermoautotrophica]